MLKFILKEVRTGVKIFTLILNWQESFAMGLERKNCNECLMRRPEKHLHINVIMVFFENTFNFKNLLKNI